ncbi:MAG: hypothetical protein ABH891_01620 [Candidatus Omnitrophota bacterium]
MSAMPIKRFFVTAFFLIFVFTAAPILSRSETPETGTDTSVALWNLAFPEEIGKVRERFAGRPEERASLANSQAGKSPRTILQIQDVHAHTIAQQNIAAILERLCTVFGIEKVALEGAWTSTSLPKSHAIPTSREKQLLAGTLLDDARISGPSYAAIMCPKSIALVGMEDETSYEKNRALFLDHLEKTEGITEKLRTYGASLEGSQRSAWGPELMIFGNGFFKFRETSDLGKFFPALLKTAEAQGVDSSDLAQMMLMRDIMALEKQFEKERLQQEVKLLMREYKNTPWTLEELVRGGKIPPEKLGFYPEIKKLTHLYRLRDQISLTELTEQIETLTGRILGKLVHAPEENTLWEKTERFYLARRILLLQASPADIKAYEIEKFLFEFELAITGLSEALSLSVDFYEVVKKRDEIFFDRIVNDPSLAGNIAIVTGGFHTNGLSQRFRDTGIPYMTVAPELGGTTMNEKLYESRMAEGGEQKAADEKLSSISTPSSTPHSSPDSDTLSELRNAIAWIDDRFSESYKVLMQTRDVREAKKVFVGDVVVVSQPARIAHLPNEGKAAPRPGAGVEVSASGLRVNEFMAKPRGEQRQTVRDWLAQGQERREKAMLVSSVSILTKMLSEKKTVRLLEEAVSNGDIISLAQDVPATEMPEALSSIRGIDRFEAVDIVMMIEKMPRFQRLAKKHPFAIMKNGHPRGAYVVLPEKPVSLVLFRIITLNPSLYRAAKDPAFLALLEDLVTEILSQELPKKSV